MTDKAIETTGQQAWKTRAIVVGAVVGLCVGAAATYIYIQNREEEAGGISAGEGVKLGVLVLGLLRSIANLGEGKA